jgi:methylsterol monooxygenase
LLDSLLQEIIMSCLGLTPWSFLLKSGTKATETAIEGKAAMSKGARILLQTAQEIASILGYVLILHGLGMLVSYLATGSPWDPWTGPWRAFLHMVGGDKYRLFVFGTYGVTSLFWWLFAGIYTFVDYTGTPAFLIKYKIQQDKNFPVPAAHIWKAAKRALFNQLLLIPFAAASYWLWEARSAGGPELDTLPSLATTLKHILVCYLVSDIWFYHSHRILHHPFLYKHVHKTHHEWTAPFSLMSLYNHPVDHVFGNQGSLSMGVLLMGSPLPVMWLWICIMLAQTIVDHCGYHLPLHSSPEFHDFHHLKFHTSYGMASGTGIWDWLYGTDDKFEASTLHKQRHFRLMDSRSTREFYPDEKSD